MEKPKAVLIDAPPESLSKLPEISLAGVSLKLVHARKTHRSFILSTWVRSEVEQNRRTILKRGPSEFRCEGDFAKGEGKLAEWLWGNSVVVVADDPDVCQAWICRTKHGILYAYTPPALRGMGIFSALVRGVCKDSKVLGTPWPFEKKPWMVYSSHVRTLSLADEIVESAE